MKMRWEDDTYVVTKYLPGTPLINAVNDAHELSKKTQLPVRFVFNEMDITVRDAKD